MLELAAGLADTGLMAARLGGESGHVLVTDLTPEMVAAARRRAEELGVQNAEFRVLDAERMDLETDSVDGVLCHWAYMLMIDPLRLSRKLGACCVQGSASILGLGRP